MSYHPTISVCMIVKNEEANLPRLLGSIRGLADEVVLVDTGSTDRTVEIAESFGAKVRHFVWCNDFSAARNESLKHATKDYILWLDGDDEIPVTEHEKIKKHLVRHPGTAVYLKLKNPNPTEETEGIQLRLFPNRKGVEFTGKVHEQVFFSLQKMGMTFTSCDGAIIHHGYEESGDILEKLRRNKAIQEKELLEEPDNAFSYFFLARTCKGLGELEDALKNYLIFIDMAKTRPEVFQLDACKIAFYEGAEISVRLGRVDEAMALLASSRDTFPDFRLFNYMRGQILFQLKDYEKAYHELLPLKEYGFNGECLPMDVKSSKAVVYKYLGISSLFVKDYAIAVDCLQKAIALEPGNGENYHYLSLTFEKSGNMAGAIKVCDEALDAVEDDGSFRKRRFLLYVKAGDFEKALSEHGRLNGQAESVDILCAMFLMYSGALNMTGIIHYYGLIQDALSLPQESFPEGLQKVRSVLGSAGEAQAAELFETAISSLLNN